MFTGKAGAYSSGAPLKGNVPALPTNIQGNGIYKHTSLLHWDWVRPRAIHGKAWSAELSMEQRVFITLSLITEGTTETIVQWKRISRKQSARWQHISQLKASALFFLPINWFVV
jgi:hypothetical protein